MQTRFHSKFDRIADIVLYTALALFGLVTLFPLYYVIVMSVTPFVELIKNGGFVLFPDKLTFSAYERILGSPTVPRAMGVTVFITIVGTVLNLVVTTLVAYPLSKKRMPGRNTILLAILFTMLFQGGLIPLYIVVQKLGLLDTVWSLILPTLVSTFNMLIMKTYFENLPHELEEAARVDGCGEWRTLLRIILPLSAPIMATLGLFYAIHHWNTYFHAVMFITDRHLYPIQVVLRNMIQSSNVADTLQVRMSTSAQQLPPETVKMATVVVSILPIIIVYPFLQKYFMKGFLLGSVKG